MGLELGTLLSVSWVSSPSPSCPRQEAVVVTGRGDHQGPGVTFQTLRPLLPRACGRNLGPSSSTEWKWWLVSVRYSAWRLAWWTVRLRSCPACPCPRVTPTAGSKLGSRAALTPAFPQVQTRPGSPLPGLAPLQPRCFAAFELGCAQTLPGRQALGGILMPRQELMASLSSRQQRCCQVFLPAGERRDSVCFVTMRFYCKGKSV